MSSNNNLQGQGQGQEQGQEQGRRTRRRITNGEGFLVWQGFLVWLGAIWAEMHAKNPYKSPLQRVRAAEQKWLKLPASVKTTYKDLEQQPILEVKTDYQLQSHQDAREAFSLYGTIQRTGENDPRIQLRGLQRDPEEIKRLQKELQDITARESRLQKKI